MVQSKYNNIGQKSEKTHNSSSEGEEPKLKWSHWFTGTELFQAAYLVFHYTHTATGMLNMMDFRAAGDGKDSVPTFGQTLADCWDMRNLELPWDSDAVCTF